MLTLLCATWAFAGPELPFVRTEEQLYERGYVRVVGDGPVWGRYRRSRGGNVAAWLFPEGFMEHFHRFEKGKRVETRRFSNAGRPTASIAWTDERPSSVTLHGPDRTLDTGAWLEQHRAGWRWFTPGPPAVQQDGLTRWQGKGWELTLTVLPEAVDVFGETLRDGLVETCACRLSDRDTAWIDGIPSARYDAVLPGPDAAWRVRTWAVPETEQTLLVSFVWDPALDPSEAAAGSAVLMLAERLEAP